MFCVGGKPHFYCLRPVEHQGIPAPTGDAPDLRVVGVADDDAAPALRFRLGRQPLDPDHIGAGGADGLHAPGLQPLQHAAQLPVGAQHHGLARRDLRRTVRLPDATAAQVLHHMGIVDQVPQHPAAAVLPRGLLRQGYRPLHAVAEAGTFGKDHFQSGSPPTLWPPRA